MSTGGILFNTVINRFKTNDLCSCLDSFLYIFFSRCALCWINADQRWTKSSWV